MMRARSTLDWSQSNNISCYIILFFITLRTQRARSKKCHGKVSIFKPSRQVEMVATKFVTRPLYIHLCRSEKI